jgi:hypothetical protein
MRKAALRTITVAGVPYRWYRYHTDEQGNSQGICMEIVTIFDPANKRAPLRLRFRERAGWGVGYPQAGVLDWRQADTRRSFNLNQPRVIAALITTARARGWDALRQAAPLVFDDPFDWLLELDQSIAPNVALRPPDA